MAAQTTEKNGPGSGFTRILENFEELSPKINTILKPIRGKCLFDKKFHNYLTNPVLESLVYFLKRHKP